jgi:hypothetical protein
MRYIIEVSSFYTSYQNNGLQNKTNCFREWFLFFKFEKYFGLIKRLKLFLDFFFFFFFLRSNLREKKNCFLKAFYKILKLYLNHVKHLECNISLKCDIIRIFEKYGAHVVPLIIVVVALVVFIDYDSDLQLPLLIVSRISSFLGWNCPHAAIDMITAQSRTTSLLNPYN